MCTSLTKVKMVISTFVFVIVIVQHAKPLVVSAHIAAMYVCTYKYLSKKLLCCPLSNASFVWTWTWTWTERKMRDLQSILIMCTTYVILLICWNFHNCLHAYRHWPKYIAHSHPKRGKITTDKSTYKYALKTTPKTHKTSYIQAIGKGDIIYIHSRLEIEKKNIIIQNSKWK